MISDVSFGANNSDVVLHAKPIKLAESRATMATAVPQVQRLDMAVMVSSLRSRAMTVVTPTAKPVCINIGVGTRRRGAVFPN